MITKGAVVDQGRRWQLTSRDLELLGWVGRWRGVTSPQIARGFDLSVKVVERRMRALSELGLVEGRRMLADVPRVHWLTRAGMTAVGIHGDVARPKLAELHHDLAVVDVAHFIERNRRHLVVTEREIRRREPNPAAGHEWRLYDGVEMTAGLGTGGLKFPDLASVRLEEMDVVWAHELERTRKDVPRLTRLMLSYVWSDAVTYVIYWTWPELYDNTMRAAEAANASARELGRGPAPIGVRVWEPSLLDSLESGTA
ncbi:helix-turn-helix transcriptional regulator [Streptomyces melanogenes]|uniref:helix-turn-helix transcriptional regulator n=1 Tax=Streptomyces melanogenes TaxID=67326 RepID=UPI00167D2E4F|nr:helix-turn-helix transcriptional regulator [Streptomyces melanogenes]